MASEIKYRIKQVGNKYYPQYKNKIFSKWKNIVFYMAHIIPDCGSLRIWSYDLCCDVLEDAQCGIKAYQCFLEHCDTSLGHVLIPCNVDNYSNSDHIYVDISVEENGLYDIWDDHLKEVREKVISLGNIHKHTAIKIHRYKE